MAKEIATISGRFIGNMLSEYPLMLLTLFNNPWFATIWAFMLTINRHSVLKIFSKIS
jgi:hypothetical protein